MRQRHRPNRHSLWFLIAVILVAPLDAAAVPVGEYQKNLQIAIALLDALVEVDEDEIPEYYELRLSEAIDEVQKVLPERHSVEGGETVCQVDNSWLYLELTELKGTPAERQRAKLEQIVLRLRALEQRVGHEQTAGTAADKTQAKQKLESILARPEYVAGARGPNALMRLLDDFIRWIEKLLPKRRPLDPSRANSISFVAQVLVVLIALSVIAYVLKILLSRFKSGRRRQITRKRKARIVLGERLDPEETATDLLSEAEALARGGDLRAAIRKAYIALLVELGDRNVISLAQHKTNRDYLNAVSSSPQLHSRMRGLTDSFERHWYGFVNATENDWQDFRAGYLAALQTGN